jgi:hypothetical protein
LNDAVKRFANFCSSQALFDEALRAFQGANPRKISDLVGNVDFFTLKTFVAIFTHDRCILTRYPAHAFLKACARHLL